MHLLPPSNSNEAYYIPLSSALRLGRCFSPLNIPKLSITCIDNLVLEHWLDASATFPSLAVVKMSGLVQPANNDILDTIWPSVHLINHVCFSKVKELALHIKFLFSSHVANPEFFDFPVEKTDLMYATRITSKPSYKLEATSF